jgi:hypothetical protein
VLLGRNPVFLIHSRLNIDEQSHPFTPDTVTVRHVKVLLR